MSDPFLEEASLRVEADKLGLTATIELARSGIDRARAAAETVQRASAALVTVDTALLGIIVSATDRVLPASALLSPLFALCAVVLSSFYVAFITQSTVVVPAPPDAPVARQRGATAAFVEAANAVVTNRLPFLRRSSVALAVAVFCLPMPFLTRSAAKPDPIPSARAVAADVPVELAVVEYKARVDAALADARRPVPLVGGVGTVAVGLLGLVLVAIDPMVFVRRRQAATTDPS